jgi:DNA primase
MYALPFSDIISKFVPLRKSGKDLVGRCPFCKYVTHNDSHFRVSEVKKLYKCFECGAGGRNVVSFLMRYYKKPFGSILMFANAEYLKGHELTPQRIRSMERKPNKDDNLPF